MSRTLDKIRRGLCLKITEKTLDELRRQKIISELTIIDTSEIALVIDLELPITYAEMEEITQRMAKQTHDTPSQLPSIFDQLRSKLGLTKEHGAIEILKAAIDRIP